MTGYGVFVVRIFGAQLTSPSLFNSHTSGMIHNRSNEYVNLSADVLIHFRNRKRSPSQSQGWRLLQRGRSWGKDQVCSPKRSNRSRGWRSQPGKSAFEIDPSPLYGSRDPSVNRCRLLTVPWRQPNLDFYRSGAARWEAYFVPIRSSLEPLELEIIGQRDVSDRLWSCALAMGIFL